MSDQSTAPSVTPSVPSSDLPWTQPVLAVIILLIYAGALVAVFFLPNDTLRTSLFGSVPVVVMAAINFYFGSSAGSAKKSDTIATDSAAKSAALAVSMPAPAESSDAVKALAAKVGS